MKRFEDGRETAALLSAHDADQFRIEKLKTENTRLIVELREMKRELSLLQNENERLQEAHDLLIEKYTALQESIEYQSVINSAEFQNRIDSLFLSILNELEEQKALNHKLTSQIHKDFTNSSKPSSQCPNRKKIVNNRERTGRMPGGQPGHEGHPRKQRKATHTVQLPLPAEVVLHPDDYEFIEFKSRKQTDIKMSVSVTELRSPVFRNRHTGKLVWAPFPEGYENEMNYGPGLKAFCCLTNNYLNVPLRKVSEFIKDLTGNDIGIAPSTICKLTKEFARRTNGDADQIFKNLMNSPYMHNDFTSDKNLTLD